LSPGLLGYSLPEPGSEKMLALYGLLDQLEQAVRDEEEYQPRPENLWVTRFQCWASAQKR